MLLKKSTKRKSGSSSALFVAHNIPGRIDTTTLFLATLNMVNNLDDTLTMDDRANVLNTRSFYTFSCLFRTFK